MLQEGGLPRHWTRALTLVAGVSLGAAAVWWLLPRNGRVAKRESGCDLDRIQVKLSELPGGEQVGVRDLGGGIMEAFGAAPDAEAVFRVLTALREEPGVEFVINRIWTPGLAQERSTDLTHPRRQSQG
jgi:hypothetical protein